MVENNLAEDNKSSSVTLDLSEAKASESKLKEVGAFLLLFIAELILFRSCLSGEYSFGTSYFGNSDALLNFIFLEHWFEMLSGQWPWSSFADLQMYYPTPNTFAYSDILLLFVPAYAFFRVCGADMFLAGTWSVILLHALGTFSMYWLCRHFLKFNILPSLLAVVVFSFGSNYTWQLSFGCIQFTAFSLMPLWGLLLGSFYFNCPILSGRSEANSGLRRLYGFLLVALTVALAATTFYIAFFLFLWFCTIVIVALLAIILAKLPIGSVLKNFFGHLWGEVLALLALVALGVWPLANFYGLVYNLLGGRSWKVVFSSLLLNYELGFTSIDNLFYGRIMKAIFDDFHTADVCMCYGWPWLTLLLFLLFFVYSWRSSFVNLWGDSGSASCSTSDTLSDSPSFKLFPKAVFYRSLAWSVAILSLATVRWGDYSLWIVAFKYFPAGDAVRYVSRLNIFLLFPMSLFLAGVTQQVLIVLGQKNLRPVARWLWQTLPIAVVILIAADNYNYLGAEASWRVDTLRTFLQRAPSAPASAKTVCVFNSRERIPRENELWYISETRGQLVFYLLAKRDKRQTINGYSGQRPSYYRCGDINSPGYVSRVEDWRRRQGIDEQSFYAYDLATGKWHPWQDVPNSKTTFYNDRASFYSPDGENVSVNSEQVDNLSNNELNSSIKNVLWHSSDAQFKGVIFPGARCLGPFCCLDPGFYRVTIIGEGIDKLGLNVYDDSSGNDPQPLNCQLGFLQADLAVMGVQLEIYCQEFLVFMLNQGQNPIKFERMEVEMVKDNLNPEKK